MFSDAQNRIDMLHRIALHCRIIPNRFAMCVQVCCMLFRYPYFPAYHFLKSDETESISTRVFHLFIVVVRVRVCRLGRERHACLHVQLHIVSLWKLWSRGMSTDLWTGKLNVFFFYLLLASSLFLSLSRFTIFFF